MVRKFLIIGVLIAIFMAFYSVPPVIAATEKFHETYEVEPGTKLEVHNKNGAVTISQWSRDAVEVSAEKTSRLGGSLNKVEIEVTLSEDRLTVRTNYLVRYPRVSVTYDIRVPEGVTVDYVETSNGTIELEGTEGDVVAETSNGKIEINNVTGDVKTMTSNGKIKIEGVEGYVDAKTSNGSIEITGVSGITGAQTSNGSIHVEVLEIQDDVQIKTSNGAIKLYVSSELNADLEMKTSNGQITLHDLEIVTSQVSKTKLTGKIGDGGQHLDVKTSNGKIDVYKLE